ncbi:hypothetical protein AMECASPLE_038121 [Ameca splendens]|uniref:Transmembrane protein n=1 Tax=Ameca splendens TaxID=208324 RepID=A0ABV1A3I0_9TELE
MLWVFFSRGYTFARGFVFRGLVEANLHGVGFVHSFSCRCSLLRSVLCCLACCGVGVVVLCVMALASVWGCILVALGLLVCSFFCSGAALFVDAAHASGWLLFGGGRWLLQACDWVSGLGIGV